MKKALIFLADGFEEVEAVGTIDVLRRGDVEVVSVSVTGNKIVTAAKGVALVADCLFEDADLQSADALVLPGGMPGSTNLNNHTGLKNLITEYYQKGKFIAAICAAPLVFGKLGLLHDKKATCYPGVEHLLKGATIIELPVVQDGAIVTGRGPGFVFDFGLKLVELLNSPEKADEVAKAMLLK